MISNIQLVTARPHINILAQIVIVRHLAPTPRWGPQDLRDGQREVLLGRNEPRYRRCSRSMCYLHEATQLEAKYLIVVDRYSSFPFVIRVTRMTTAKTIEKLTNIFSCMGWPSSLRSDGGPAFRLEFADWCERKGIHW